MAFISEVTSIFLQRFYTGWITLRNQLTVPIRVMGRRVVELYDALIAGNDWEVTPWLSLKRRAGHTAYATINYAALAMYSWKSNTQGTIPIIDTTGDIEYISNGVNVLAAKTAGAGLGQQSSILGIGNYLYVGNPTLTFKWDGPAGLQGVTNWGIANPTSSSGPTLCTVGTQVGRAPSLSWTNPANFASAVAYASCISPSTGGTSKLLEGTGFGFTVPAGSLTTSIEVIFDMTISGGFVEAYVVPLVNGSQHGIFSYLGKFVAGSYTVDQTRDAGAFSDSAFTDTQVNGTGFGYALLFIMSPSTTVLAKNGRMTVYQSATPTVTVTGSGTFSAVNGFTYVMAYGNSTSGEVSNATPPSLNTGPFTNVAYVGIGVTASADPQVNQIRIYRTTDSGGGNQFFEISNSPFPNTTATVQDTTPDTSLQVTSQAEINLGNTPPPSGLTNLAWWSGRMWGSTNNLLWASTGPETISGTAPNSNWNPLFQWVIPGVIVRNVPGPNGMLIFTQDDCYIVRGTDITNYTVNEFVKDFGVRSYNALDTDGTNLYVFTSDRQFILLASSGAQDIGLPIADQLLMLDPTAIYVKVNRYGLDSIVRILNTVAQA